MIILGIDPGSLHTGYGVIECVERQRYVRAYGVVDLAAKGDHITRLKAIYDEVTQVIKRSGPDACAIEMPVYGKNPQSMLKLGRAQAAAMLAALNQGVSITQYTPKMVKLSVTGNGDASKDQVSYMVRSLLVWAKEPPRLRHDASDALAIALCHSHKGLDLSGAADHKDWAAYLQAHPERVSR